MSADTETVSNQVVTKGNLDKDACQKVCDKDPKNCFAYQIDLSQNAESKCSIFNEEEMMEGDGAITASCYLYQKSVEEIIIEDAEKVKLAVQKSTRIQHFMSGFTAKMGHLEIVLKSLPQENQDAALKCISTQQRPSDPITATSSYEDTQKSINKISKGYLECLRVQKPELVPRGGYCGAPSNKETELPFTCAINNCCGKALATGAGEETAIYTCQKIGNASYQPLKMKGFEEFDSDEDWPFSCPEEQITGAFKTMYGISAVALSMLVFYV